MIVNWVASFIKMSPFQLVYVVVALAGVATARNVYFTSCEESEDTCTISQVDITPCQNRYSCKFTIGSMSYASASFTPNFSARRLRGAVYVFDDIEIKSTDICEYTSCPTRSGVEQDFNLSIKPKWYHPTGTHDLKIKFWDKDDPSNKCCLKMQMRLGW